MQNRVDPCGNIIDIAARGSWLGNRGQLHDDTKFIQRPFKLKAWLTCVLQFKDRRRSVMSPGLYTELFFLDEATAFATVLVVSVAGRIITGLKFIGLKEILIISLPRKLPYSTLMPSCTRKELTMQVIK